MSKSIKEILMDRDSMTAEEAEETIHLALVELDDRLRDPETYGDPETICEDYLGIDPDYIEELADLL